MAKQTSQSWKSRGHYLRDGTEWKGNQHAMSNGKIHTGKTHTKTSKPLFHFRDLSKTAQSKILKEHGYNFKYFAPRFNILKNCRCLYFNLY